MSGTTTVTVAKALLLSKEARAEAGGLAGEIGYVELTKEVDFSRESLRAIDIPYSKTRS